MPFQKDDSIADDVRRIFGEYVETFLSSSGQVRADLFRRGKTVVAHVSFPTGLDVQTVTDPYVGALWGYARQHGFADRFQVVISSNSSL